MFMLPPRAYYMVGPIPSPALGGAFVTGSGTCDVPYVVSVYPGTPWTSTMTNQVPRDITCMRF